MDEAAKYWNNMFHSGLKPEDEDTVAIAPTEIIPCFDEVCPCTFDV